MALSQICRNRALECSQLTVGRRSPVVICPHEHLLARLAFGDAHKAATPTLLSHARKQDRRAIARPNEPRPTPGRVERQQPQRQRRTRQSQSVNPGSRIARSCPLCAKSRHRRFLCFDRRFRSHSDTGVSGFISYDFCKLAGRLPSPSLIFLLQGASMRCFVSSSIDFGSRFR